MVIFMGKEKKRFIDENEQKETVFYYEITGFILILFSLITFINNLITFI